ncbi:MAG: hypothetical protein JWQ55_3197 [Rhodopila sp.]|nr:hypothetical protein [Rhodopila sp.]
MGSPGARCGAGTAHHGAYHGDLTAGVAPEVGLERRQQQGVRLHHAQEGQVAGQTEPEAEGADEAADVEHARTVRQHRGEETGLVPPPFAVLKQMQANYVIRHAGHRHASVAGPDLGDCQAGLGRDEIREVIVAPLHQHVLATFPKRVILSVRFPR